MRKTDPLQGLRTWNSDNNPVVWARFGVRFDAVPAIETVKGLVALHDAVKSEYPMLSTKPAREHSRKDAKAERLGGVMFHQPGPDRKDVRRICFEEADAGLSKSSLSVRREDYGTWESVWEREVSGIFGRILPPLLKEVKMTVVELVMSRRFVWDMRPNRSRLGKMFRRGSPLVPSALFQEEAGAFSDLAYVNSVRDGSGKAWLMAHNIETKLVPDVPAEMWGKKWVDIEIYQILFTNVSPEGRSGAFSPDAGAPKGHIKKRLNHYMGILHQENQRALSGILSEAACRKFEIRGPDGGTRR